MSDYDNFALNFGLAAGVIMGVFLALAFVALADLQKPERYCYALADANGALTTMGDFPECRDLILDEVLGEERSLQ